MRVGAPMHPHRTAHGLGRHRRRRAWSRASSHGAARRCRRSTTCARGSSDVRDGRDRAARRALSERSAAARRRSQRAARRTASSAVGARGREGRRSRARPEDAARRARAGGRARRRGRARTSWPRRSAQQVERMRRQIDYHLAHARAAASGATPGARCAVARRRPRGSSRTLLRLHAERGLAIDVAGRRRARGPRPARGSRRDARQPARQRLQVGAVARRRSRRRATATRVVITVDDDGPGLEPSMRDAVLQRGVRADEAAPGSGLRPRDRPRSRGALRRIDRARRRADGRPARAASTLPAC